MATEPNETKKLSNEADKVDKKRKFQEIDSSPMSSPIATKKMRLNNDEPCAKDKQSPIQQQADDDNEDHKKETIDDGADPDEAKQNHESSSKCTGFVKFFNNKRGYGFIANDDGSSDLFVHQSDIYCQGVPALTQNEKVEFDIEQQHDGRLKALNVTGPDGAYCTAREEKERKKRSNDPSSHISSFDVNPILNKTYSQHQKPPSMSVDLLTYFHTNRAQSFLEYNSNIKPFEITSEALESVNNQRRLQTNQIDLKSVPIQYSTETTASLQEGPPPKHVLEQLFSNIDPLHTQIQHIVNAKCAEDTNDIEPTFITFRRNIRSIASVVLHKLDLYKIRERTGVNIAIYWDGKRIVLENIKQINPNKKNRTAPVQSLYGFVWEHVLQLDNGNALNIQKHIDRDEIRALLKLQMADDTGDITVFCGAEIDAIMNDKVVELKCSKLNSNRRSKLKEIADGKLLKMWTQCYFGGVDKLIIGFHDGGVIGSVKQLNTTQIEDLFPNITKQCIDVVHQVLKWIKNIIKKEATNNLYHLHFDAHRSNTSFVLQPLAVTESDKIKIIELMSQKHGDETDTETRLNVGLIINACTKEIKLTPA